MGQQQHKGIFHTKSLNSLTIFTLLLLCHNCICSKTTESIGEDGAWELLRENIGVVAMHMTLTHKNTVLIFDQTGAGPSGYLLKKRAHGEECHVNHANDLKDSTCFAHSVEYHIDTNEVRPLRIESDPFCSSGSFLRNGTLLQTGGYANGYKKIRYFQPCDDGRCDWRLSRARLAKNRWYASNQILPGEKERVIVVGGKKVHSYEFIPRKSPDIPSYKLPFLMHTYNKSEGGNNLYPFLHLSSDGHLFIFANRDSILFNYRLNEVIKKYPRMPGGGSRNYPSSGSSVILPLEHHDGFQKVEVMVCGGAVEGAYTAAQAGKYLEGLKTCGRMVITGHKHEWKMEKMPHSRLLMNMVILPTGDILIINGARQGAGGWNNADLAARTPFLYTPRRPISERFSILKETDVPRMYHSSAILLPDGRVLVAGSNPNKRYEFQDVRYPTELKLQAFSPHYTDHFYRHSRPTNVSIKNIDHNNEYFQLIRSNFDFMKKTNKSVNHTKPSKKSKEKIHVGTHHHPKLKNGVHHNSTLHNSTHNNSTRPKIISPRQKGNNTHHRNGNRRKVDHKRARSSKVEKNKGNETIDIRYGEEFEVKFKVRRKLNNNEVEFNVYAPPFTTHSVAMNQRLLKLRSMKIVKDDEGWLNAVVQAPPSANVAPPGYYMLFLVNEGIPSTAKWIRFVHA